MILKNAIAILSGAGRINGVGAATARLLAREGCNTLINCLKNKDQALQVANECKNLGVESDIFLGDITKQETCSSMAKYVEDKWGRADILINCVGVTKKCFL